MDTDEQLYQGSSGDEEEDTGESDVVSDAGLAAFHPFELNLRQIVDISV